MKCSIAISNKARRQLKRLSGDLLRRISNRFDSLEENPESKGKKLKGFDDIYATRVGNYRIIYQVKESELIVLVVKVGHRREVYRK